MAAAKARVGLVVEPLHYSWPEVATETGHHPCSWLAQMEVGVEVLAMVMEVVAVRAVVAAEATVVMVGCIRV